MVDVTPSYATISTSDWDRLIDNLEERKPVTIKFPPIVGLIIKSSGWVPVGKIVWHDKQGTVISVEDLAGLADTTPTDPGISVGWRRE